MILFLNAALFNRLVSDDILLRYFFFIRSDGNKNEFSAP